MRRRPRRLLPGDRGREALRGCKSLTAHTNYF